VNSDLLNELRTAYQAQTAAHAKWVKAREAASESRLAERTAHEEYERAAAVVEETGTELYRAMRANEVIPTRERHHE
jgi:hypothetical protein